MIIVTQHPGFVEFLSAKVGVELDPINVKTITDISPSGKIQAVVGFTNCNDNNVEILVAFEEGYQVTKRLIRCCVNYAFNTIGVKRITALTHEKNIKCQVFNKRMGMRLETPEPLEDWFTDGGAYMYGLLRSECKWLD